jgi:hypothetical protein
MVLENSVLRRLFRLKKSETRVNEDIYIKRNVVICTLQQI